MDQKMSYDTKSRSKLEYLIYPGIILLISGISFLFLWPNLVRYITNSNLALTPDSKVFEAWSKPPGASYLEIYMFNWTNPDDVHNDDIKPRFEEIGPFTFREIKEKVNITWNSNDTISYRLRKTWFFDRALSCCDLSTNITVINSVQVAISHKVRGWSIIPRTTANIAMKALTPHLSLTKNASELLFNGYIDQLLAMGKSFPGLSSLPPVERFGFFYGKNGSTTYDGYFNMQASGSKRGTLRRWNYVEQTAFYQDECSNVKGSAGEFYPAGVKRDHISFFSPDMCRNLKLDYEEDVLVHGVKGYKYIAHNSMLDNGTLIPENACYCNGDCMPSGVLNVSSCRHGSPSFTSLPHFLHADPIYLKGVEGLKPDKDKHQLFIVVEPNTGLILQAAGRVQINIHLKPIMYMSLINDVPNVIYPILWFQAKYHASEELASGLKFLMKLPTIMKAISISATVLGLIMLAISLYQKRKKFAAEKITYQEQVPLRKGTY